MSTYALPTSHLSFPRQFFAHMPSRVAYSLQSPRVSARGWLAVRLVCEAARSPRRQLPALPCAPRLSAQALRSRPTRCRPPAGDPARANPQGNARPRWQQGRLQYTLKQGMTTTYPAYIKTLSVPTLPGSYSYHIITQHKVGYINRDIHRADTHTIR